MESEKSHEEYLAYLREKLTQKTLMIIEEKEINVGLEYKHFLLARGYHDSEETDSDEKNMRNYYTFHYLIGSTVAPEVTLPFSDFPGECSAEVFLDSLSSE